MPRTPSLEFRCGAKSVSPRVGRVVSLAQRPSVLHVARASETALLARMQPQCFGGIRSITMSSANLADMARTRRSAHPCVSDLSTQQGLRRFHGRRSIVCSRSRPRPVIVVTGSSHSADELETSFDNTIGYQAHSRQILKVRTFWRICSENKYAKMF
jgi:hypothetical protein